MKTSSLIAYLAISSISFTQTVQETLDQNNCSAIISNTGTIFRDYGANPGAGYEIPKGSGNNAIFGAQFWFGGEDMNGQRHYALGEGDLYPGPISPSFSYNDSTYQATWGKSIWKICQPEIDNFVKWFESTLPGASDTVGFYFPSYETMETIYTWPAHGDLTQGMSYNLAPFYDRDHNGIYEPLNGDYPIIKGCCATYMIQNDANGSHASGELNLGMEVHSLIYQYESGDYIDNATFVDLMLINRGTSSFFDFQYGLMLDADLGDGLDDFMGSDSTTNMMYFYNADNLDEDYGTNPPAIGIVSLVENLSACVPLTSNPTTAEKLQLLHGLQNSGNSWVHPDNYSTSYAYSGNPADLTAWSEVSAGNVQGDRKGLSIGSRDAMGYQDTVFQSYAIIYARSGNNLENVAALMNLAADVKNFYNNDTLMCSPYVNTAAVPENDKSEVSLYPNPTNGELNLVLDFKGDVKADLLDLSAKLLHSESLKSKHTKLDFSTFPKGIYFLKLSSKETSSMYKIILE